MSASGRMKAASDVKFGAGARSNISGTVGYKCTKFGESIELNIFYISFKFYGSSSLRSPVIRKNVFRYAGPYLRIYVMHCNQILHADSFYASL